MSGVALRPGETPHEFLTRMRLERAKDLLTISSRPVTEICFDVGFTSLGSFSTLFRRQVGLSPAAFRRRVRAWVTVPGRHPIQDAMAELGLAPGPNPYLYST